MRKIEYSDKKNTIHQLLNSLVIGVSSMVNEYNNYFTKNELFFLKQCNIILIKALELLKNNYTIDDFKYIEKAIFLENELKKYCFRCWERESGGYSFVSWLKTNYINEMPPIVSATFNRIDSNTFCGLTCGIKYDVSENGFLGALNTDAAVLIESTEKRSIYTIAELDDLRVVNSYNLATPVITPSIVCDLEENKNFTKYNEIILDSRFIKPVCIVCLSELEVDIAKKVSEKLNIPIEYNNSIRDK